MGKLRTVMLVLVAMNAATTHAYAQLLVPMDNQQANHLKAYGLTYWVLDHKLTAEWLLNYRAGSFLLPDRPDVRREAALRGVTFDAQSPTQVAQIRQEIAGSNMETVILE